MNISELNHAAAAAEDRLRDLRSQYKEWIAGMRENGYHAEADVAQAEWDRLRAPNERVIAERDARVA
jgi:hypothetical protein